MNLRLLYPVHAKSVRLEKILDGLWVAAPEERVLSAEESESEFFRSVDVFKRSLNKMGQQSRQVGGAVTQPID